MPPTTRSMGGMLQLPPQTPPGTTAPSEGQQFSNQALFNPENPQFALQNAILARGGNPFRSNPFMGMLMQTAPGLAQAFNISQALAPGVGPGASLNGGADFANFLAGALGSHKIPSIMQGAASALPDVVNAIRAQQDAMAQGGNTLNANPYLTMLQDTMDNGFGMGTARILQSLYSPFMNRGLQGGYASNLQNAVNNNTRVMSSAVAQNPDLLTNGGLDVWQYLLGMGAPNVMPGAGGGGQPMLPGAGGTAPPQMPGRPY